MVFLFDSATYICITDQRKEDVMKQLTHVPLTPAGAPLTTCDPDDTCAELDCDAVLEEFGETLGKTAEGKEFIAHYCGLDYVELLRDRELPDAWQDE